MANQYRVTMQNFVSFMEMVIQGTNRAESYQNECFSLSEVLRAKDCYYVLEEIMQQMYDCGYDPFICKPILEKYDRTYLVDQEPRLKQSLDEQFVLELDGFAKVIDYFYAVSRLEKGDRIV